MGTTCSSSAHEAARERRRACNAHTASSSGTADTEDTLYTDSEAPPQDQQQVDLTCSPRPTESAAASPTPPMAHSGDNHDATSISADEATAAVELTQRFWGRVLTLASMKQIEDVLFAHMFDAYREILGATPLRLWNLSAHVTKLIEVLDVAIGTLHNYAAVEPGLLQLGQKHAGYGVDPQSYGIFGAAMVQVFKTVLGEEFTREQEAAWRVVFGRVTASMRRGAESPAGQRAAMNFKRMHAKPKA